MKLAYSLLESSSVSVVGETEGVSGEGGSANVGGGFIGRTSLDGDSNLKNIGRY